MLNILILKKNWGLNNFKIFNLFIYLTLVFVNVSYSQDCTIIISKGSDIEKLEYLKLDTIKFNHDEVIVLIIVSRSGGYKYHKIYKENEKYYYHSINGKTSVIQTKKRIRALNKVFKKITVDNLIYETYSQNVSMHYYNVLIVKKSQKIDYYVPIGSNIEYNKDCYMNLNKDFKFIYKVLKRIVVVN